MSINDKQQAFVEHYCTDAAFNATQAYSLAYPLCNAGQAQSASALLTNPNIIQAIAKRKAELVAKSEYDLNTWLQQTLTARAKASSDNNLSVCAAYDRLLAQYVGALEADNRQKQATLQVAIKTEQTFIDEAIATARALDDAPDAMAR